MVVGIVGDEMTTLLQTVGEKGAAALGVDKTAMLLETLASLRAAQREMNVAERNRHFLLCFEDGSDPSNLGLAMQRLGLHLRVMIERVQKQLVKDPVIIGRGLRVTENLMEHRKANR